MTKPHAMRLPQPDFAGEVSVEQALLGRRSERAFSRRAVYLAELSQLLWAAQGVTSPRGYRTAPSAGASYPLEIRAAAGLVAELPAGIYRYRSPDHTLTLSAAGDPREDLAQAALGQRCVARASVVLVVSAVYARVCAAYGRRGVRYADMEAGHAAQNVSLQAVALGLGTVVIGAFDDARVRGVAALSPDEEPLYLIPVGR
ncbi:MAG: SagB/ThcOx family dehydrogenase [Desulfobacterales bacterium]